MHREVITGICISTGRGIIRIVHDQLDITIFFKGCHKFYINIDFIGILKFFYVIYLRYKVRRGASTYPPYSNLAIH